MKFLLLSAERGTFWLGATLVETEGADDEFLGTGFNPKSVSQQIPFSFCREWKFSSTSKAEAKRVLERWIAALGTEAEGKATYAWTAQPLGNVRVNVTFNSDPEKSKLLSEESKWQHNVWKSCHAKYFPVVLQEWSGTSTIKKKLPTIRDHIKINSILPLGISQEVRTCSGWQNGIRGFTYWTLQ